MPVLVNDMYKFQPPDRSLNFRFQLLPTRQPARTQQIRPCLAFHTLPYMTLYPLFLRPLTSTSPLRRHVQKAECRISVLFPGIQTGI